MDEAVVIATGVLQVPGIDCPDCAAKIEKAVRQLPGVVGANFAFALGTLKIEYDPDRVAIPQAIERVRALGYQAWAQNVSRPGEPEAASTTTATIRLAGLDCPDCAAKLESRIRALPGVRSASLNFGAATLQVTYQGTAAPILAAISDQGLKGQLEGTGEERLAKAPLLAVNWAANRYALPTIISGAAIAIAFIMERSGVPIPIVRLLYAAAAVVSGFLPARTGVLTLLRSRQFDMNILMTIAALGAIALGQLEEAAVVTFLFSLGNGLQAFALDKTRNSIRELMDLSPKEALLRRNGDEVVLPVAEIRLDDIVIIRPGERIPMDGRVTSGESSVNQAPITGESLPVAKKPGDYVFAGTINERGSLEIGVTRLASDNTIARIIKLVEEAQGRRAPSQQFIDRFARYYTPAVILAAALVAIIPPLVLNQPFARWFYEALAMLLVACPCALVISTPVSIVSAIGSAARNGILIKGGSYLEEMGALSVIAFDKTGTLTHGRPEVTEVIPFAGLTESELLSLAAGIESRSEHLLGEAIVRLARERELPVPDVSDFIAITGKGARGKIDGRLYFIGSEALISDEGLSAGHIAGTVDGLQKQGKTVMILGDQDGVLGLIAVADTLRGNSRQTLAGLKQAGITDVVMLTGDNDTTAREIAAHAGVDDYMAGLLPEDKVRAVGDLLARHRKVAMVGDGVNDAPAMAMATVSIAMGVAGTDTALETADIVLMGDDLSKLPYIMKLSRKTLAVIKQNIVLSLALKAVVLLLVVPGWLTLWLAVLADMGSSLLVTLNGMRLIGTKPSLN
jgi:Cd2+/Zn2+-exporting ATPase